MDDVPVKRGTKIRGDVKQGDVGKVGDVDGKVPDNANLISEKYDPSKPLSPSNYPVVDPDYSIPAVRYDPKTVEKVIRMRRGKGPTTKASHGLNNIETHHRAQKSVNNGGIIDDLTEYTHRRGGNHSRHSLPSEITPAQRAKEIRDYWKARGSEYIMPGEGI